MISSFSLFFGTDFCIPDNVTVSFHVMLRNFPKVIKSSLQRFITMSQVKIRGHLSRS